MESLRYFRISIPGWMFLITIASVSLTPDKIETISLNLNWIKGDVFITLAGLLLASPILGLIITTIAYWFIHSLFGYGVYFPVCSKDKKYTSKLFKHLRGLYKSDTEQLKQLEEGLNRLNSRRQNNRNYKLLFDYYQVFLRKKMKNEIFTYTNTAWNFFYINLNNQIAIILALLFSIPLFSKNIAYYQLILLILIGIYFVTSFWHVFKCRKDAITLEKNWIISLK